MKDDVDEDETGASCSGSVIETTMPHNVVNTRVSRNRSEKQRRDNINIQIATMADSLPIVHTSPKKMDKISILRIAASYLRANYTIGPGKKNFLPSQLEHFDVEQWILDRFGDGSMFLAISTTGKIIYVSKNVEQLLGYPQSELFGHNIQSFVPAEDHEVLMRNLTPDELLNSNNLRITDGSMENSNSSEDSASVAGHRKPFREQRRCFEFRIAQRPNSRREHNTQYERFTVTGKLRRADFCESSGSQMRHRDATSNDIFFIGIATIIAKRPITELSLMDAKLKEYITRHLVDGRIIFCDHRISIVAGYLSEEVSGKSAFNFMHKEDFHWTIVGLRQMYVRGEGYGWSCYRLRAKNGDYIYLKTYGYLEYDKNTQSVESFVCVNKQLTKEEGEEGIREMKARFSATVSGNNSPMTDDEDIDIGSDSQRSNSMTSFEDPPLKKVEDAITYLVSDLPSSLKKIKSPPVQAEQYETAATISQNLPPASEQASKLGITSLNGYPVLDQDEDKHNVRSPQPTCVVKKEPNIADKVIGSPSSIVQQPQRRFMNIGNNEIIEETDLCKSQQGNVTTSSPSSHRCEQHRTVKREKTPSNQTGITITSNNHLQRNSPSINSNQIDKCSDVSPDNIHVINEMTEYPSSSNTVLRNVNVIRSTSCQVKLEPNNVLVGYTDNCTNDLIISSDTVSSQSELSQQHTLKRRTCNDEDCRNLPNKKKQQANFRYLTDHMNGSMVGEETLVEELTEPDVNLINLTADYNQVEPSSLREEESKLVTQSTQLSNEEDEMRYMRETRNFENRLITHPDSQSLQIENGTMELPLLDHGLNNDASSTVYFMNTPENLNELQTRLSMQQAFDERIFKIHGEIEYSVAVYESTLKEMAPNISEVQSKKYNQIQADCKTLKQDLITLQQDHHNNMQHQG